MARFEPVDNTSNPLFKQAGTPDKYIDLGSYINDVNRPDNRDALVEAYGDQLITGPLSFTESVGASQAVGENDEVTYWEAPRLHKTQNGTMASVAASDTSAKLITTSANHSIVEGDVVMINGYIRARATPATATTYNVVPYAAAWGVTIAANEFVKVHKIGNEFAQGTDQPTEFELSNLVKRVQPFIITKMTYSVNGSQMGNIGWVRDTETGSLYWHQKGLSDQRKRYKNLNEAQAIFGEAAANTNLTGVNINGSEGYVSAIEKRGTVNTGYITDKTDLQELSVILDAQGAPSDYCWMMNRRQANYVDNFIGEAMGNQPYGVVSNSAEMDVKLGFKNFSVGNRNFATKVLPIFTDPTFAGQTDYYKFFMTPMGTAADPKTGIQAPTLQFNYKAYEGGAKRYMEHWMLGGVNGTYTNGSDKRSFEWRSEFNLITRGANRHVVGKGE